MVNSKSNSIKPKTREKNQRWHLRFSLSGSTRKLSLGVASLRLASRQMKTCKPKATTSILIRLGFQVFALSGFRASYTPFLPHYAFLVFFSELLLGLPTDDAKGTKQSSYGLRSFPLLLSERCDAHLGKWSLYS
jgi:hypothetical protein